MKYFTAAFFIFISFGCKPAEEIRSYSVPKEQIPVATAPAPPAAQPTGEPTDRMLGAMLPGAAQAWFFKLVGPKTDLDRMADQVTKFYASVKLEGGEPTWEMPTNWLSEPASGMRFATLRVPSKGPALELSVIGLPRAGDWPQQVLDNVNRWRGQMKLPPVEKDAATELEGATPDAMLVDIAGWFDAGGMAPPMMGGAPPEAANTQAVGGEEATGDAGFTSKAPQGWVEGPPTMMRKATFIVGDAEATVTMFPAMEMMVDPLANLNRWRGEVGLPPLGDQELAANMTEIKLVDSPAQLFEITGEELATRAVMTRRGEQMWFFKFRGPQATVSANTAAFDEWISSVQFSQEEK